MRNRFYQKKAVPCFWDSLFFAGGRIIVDPHTGLNFLSKLISLIPGIFMSRTIISLKPGLIRKKDNIKIVKK